MPKGYIIANIRVEDPEGYEIYRANNAAIFARHGARVLVRGGPQEVLEGEFLPRTVVIEFDSPEAARAMYDDPDYTENKAIRQGAAQSHLLLVEGQ